MRKIIVLLVAVAALAVAAPAFPLAIVNPQTGACNTAVDPFAGPFVAHVFDHSFGPWNAVGNTTNALEGDGFPGPVTPNASHSAIEGVFC